MSHQREPRTTYAQKETMDDEQTAIVENAKTIFDRAFATAVMASGLSQKDFATRMYPAIQNSEAISRIINGAENRHANLEILVALRLVFGVSLDTVIDNAIMDRRRRLEIERLRKLEIETNRK